MARVLLVDDDIAEISAVKRVLSRAGHQPVLATNAADALASVAQSPPDLLLVGATCEGGDALRRVAEEQGARDLPLLVLGETPAAPEGADQLARPVDPAQLSERVAARLASATRAAPPPASAPPPAAPRPARGAASPARPVPAPAPAGAAPDAAAAARRAAAAALLARAAELRRPGPAAPPPAPPEPEPEDPGLEAILRRAEEAERAHAAERKARVRQADRATVEAAQRAEAERVAVEKSARAQAAEERIRSEERARAAAEEKAQAGERARAAAEEKAQAGERARAAAEEKAQAGERARAAAEQKAQAQARARAVAEKKARSEAAARARVEEEGRSRAEQQRHAAEEEARRAEAAEVRASTEADARRRLEDELDSLRDQVETERRTAERKIQTVMERAEAEERAAEDIRRLAEEDAERRRLADEEQLRGAISSARAEMDALRRKGEEEARRRAEAEAEVARLAREAERRAAEAAAQPAPFEFPVYRPPSEDPAPDPAEEAARRRVAALRERAAPDDGEPVDGAPPRPARAPPPELRGGTLADLPAPRLLALAALAEITGRIDLEGETSRSVWLEHGRIVGAASGDPADRVEECALRLGLVTRDQHRQVAGAATSLSPRRTALLLLERGFLKPTELTALVRRRTEEVVFGAFSDAGARFRWAAAEVPPDERTALERGTLALAVEGVRRRWLAPRVDAVLGGPGTLLSPVSTGPSAADLGLSPQERRAVALADGLRTLDEIVAASPLDPLSTRQVLAALVLVGSLAVRVFQGGRPAAAATAAIDLARVREKLEQARRADYFTVLGVSRLCTPHEVRDAAARLSTEFDPRRYQGIREDGLEARLGEILDVVADAREILADDALRAEYLRGLGD